MLSILFQSKEKSQKKQVTDQATDVNTCSLCGMKDLYFDPPARYCAACYKKINPKGICYSMSIAYGSDQQTLVCRECFNNPCEIVDLGGKSVLKANLRKIKNYAENEELDEWVRLLLIIFPNYFLFIICVKDL